jgi:hypothetical protein
VRSEIIFQAQKIVANKYELCNTVAKLTRRTHFLSPCTQDAIVDAFVTVANDLSPRAPTSRTQQRKRPKKRAETTVVAASEFVSPFDVTCILAQDVCSYSSQRL